MFKSAASISFKKPVAADSNVNELRLGTPPCPALGPTVQGACATHIEAEGEEVTLGEAEGDSVTELVAEVEAVTVGVAVRLGVTLRVGDR